MHLLGGRTPRGAGCGVLEVLHEGYDILGNKTGCDNAAGCLMRLATYPFAPFQGSGGIFPGPRPRPGASLRL